METVSPSTMGDCLSKLQLSGINTDTTGTVYLSVQTSDDYTVLAIRIVPSSVFHRIDFRYWGSGLFGDVL
uniref:Uncharacterized protein n=1 Tax=Setaria digitata TaxID=48799 RepID=A0A915PMQ7_9BILA